MDGPGALRDELGRPLRDLRISVTDRCNFRCQYCMPKELFGARHRFLARRKLLSFEEIQRLARLFIELGVGKIRLTGGEPLLRHSLETLVEMLAELPGLADLSLTTNGSLLTPAKAKALKVAGLNRVNISLDAVDDDTFGTINGVNFPVAGVIEAVENAASAGLEPVKVNMVLRRGVNDHALLPMARYFRGTGHVLRIIEYMDVGASNGWRLREVVPATTVIGEISREFPLRAAGPDGAGDVARRWLYSDGKGEIGTIASVTQPFCRDCSRARLSAEGVLYTCLFACRGDDLRRLLRQGTSDEELSRAIGTIWSRRNDRYSEMRSSTTESLPKIEMSYIGG